MYILQIEGCYTQILVKTHFLRKKTNNQFEIIVETQLRMGRKCYQSKCLDFLQLSIFITFLASMANLLRLSIMSII
jgi:hypothetical protein